MKISCTTHPELGAIKPTVLSIGANGQKQLEFACPKRDFVLVYWTKIKP